MIKYGWQICDEVQTFASGSADMQFVPREAYDALAAQNHTLKLKFEEINLSWQAVCADLEAKLALAVEALKEISNPNDSLPDTNYYAICEYDIRRAKNALSKIGGAE